MHRHFTTRWILVATVAALACVRVYHLWLRQLMEAGDLRLGAVSHRLAPIYAYWRPHIKGWLIWPILTLCAYFWTLKRTNLLANLSDRAALASLFAWAVAITTTVAMLDGGPRRLPEPFQRTDLEYFGAVERVESVSAFLREFPTRMDDLPMHATTHPPGAILFLWLSQQLLWEGPDAAAWFTIVFGCLTVCPVFFWARDVSDSQTARVAASIFVLSPSVVLFTATSMDGPFAVILISAAWLGHRAIDRQSWRWGLAAGAMLAAGALMTY